MATPMELQLYFCTEVRVAAAKVIKHDYSTQNTIE
jgi:hypothetical protein